VIGGVGWDLLIMYSVRGHQGEYTEEGSGIDQGEPGLETKNPNPMPEVSRRPIVPLARFEDRMRCLGGNDMFEIIC
jgi:hypothetical protein